MIRIFKILLFLSITFSNSYSQYNGNNFSISGNFNYSTSGRIFLTPDADNVFDRNNYFGIDHVYGYSAEIRFRLNEDLILGLSGEYLEASEDGRNIVTSSQFVVTDGFELIPLELSAYYHLPFSTESFKFFMGGGFGFYFGKRFRQFGDLEYMDVSSELGFGIQISTGMDYMIFDYLSVRGEFRFRDPDFKVTNRYSSDIVNYEGRSYRISTDEITSKINLDGITFRIGATFHFPVEY
ncbi:MAG: hypothetical protein R3250_05150 [Melioribacteraceae bacterium]|nr:hypothetical protein [Melioribacteraceae bacterium]